MAPEGKNKKRKTPPATTSSEVSSKKSKKEKTAKVVPTITAPPTTFHKPSTIVSQMAVEGNLPAITSKQSRKRAADFLGDDEEGIDLSTDQSTASKSKKKNSNKSIEDKTTTEDTPVPEVISRRAEHATAKPKQTAKNAKANTKNFAQIIQKSASEWPNEAMKKGPKKNLLKDDSLTADGVNGVLGHSSDEDVEITTANREPSTSMQAEAQRTVDKEMADEIATEDESDDTGAALLAGFDSDNEDHGQDVGLDPKKMKDLDLSKNDRKKLRQAERKGKKGESGAVYIGRIPHGFHENEMRQYFSQFGIITNLRLSRNRKTGASKHFAFVEFESNEVAKIVAQSMDNYLMYGHILKCKYAPTESLHPDLWKGANKRFKKVPFNKIEKKKLEEPKTKDQWIGKIAREQSKRASKAERMKSIGYEYEMPQIKTVDEALEQKMTKNLAQDEVKLVEAAAEAEELKVAIEPINGVPKDSVAMAKETKPKKSKNGIIAADNFSESVAAALVEGTKLKKGKMSKKVAKESIMPAVNGDDQATADLPKSTISKKSMKKGKMSATETETSSFTQPPKFAFHPDEIQELSQAKPDKQKKSKSADHTAVQMQLNAELNEAAEPFKEDAVESDAEIAATATVMPTPGGSHKEMQTPSGKTKKEKRKSKVLTESVGITKNAKNVKKSAVP